MARKKLTNLILHVSATPEGRDVTPQQVLRMHMGPCDNKNGTVTYKGKVYPNRAALPKENLYGYPIAKMKGRGWSRPGYSKIITLDGFVHVIIQDNGDQWVDDNEITYGATGMNSFSKHICLIGGMTKDMKAAKDTRTPEQLESLKKEVLDILKKHPDIKIGGHNQYSAKACPCFSVPKWLESIGVDKKNIDYSDPYGYVKRYNA